MACGYDYIIFYSCFRKATYLHVTTPTVLFLNLCEIHAQNVALAALFFFFFLILICSLSLVCNFQFYFLKGELTAHPKSSGPLYPKVYPYDIGNTLPFCFRDNTRKT